MLRSLFSGISGMKNHQVKLDVIGNNIANVNTTGFKAKRVLFKDVISQTLKSGNTGENPLQVGLGTALGSIDALQTTGNLQSTGRATDMALEGNGYFMTKNDNGQLSMTRAGSFIWNHEGYLINSITEEKVVGISGYFDAQSTDVTASGFALAAGQQFTIDPGDGGTPVTVTTTGTTWDQVVDDINLQLNGKVEAFLDSNQKIHLRSLKPGSTVQVTADTDGMMQAINMVDGAMAFNDVIDNGSLKVQEIKINPDHLNSVKTVSVQPDGNIVFDATKEIKFNSDIGYTLDKMSVAVITVPNPNGLDQTGDNRYKATLAGVGGSSLNGIPRNDVLRDFNMLKTFAQTQNLQGLIDKTGMQIAGAGGSGLIRSGFLEMSNVDLAEEFSNMIVTQRGFQANARIITTSDEMLQELVNLKR